MRTWDRREVLTFLDRVEPALASLDYFELLDVGPGADDAAIQGAFHAMAAALHPDRHRNQLDAHQRERLTIVYAQIAEAYRVLRDPTLRQAYLVEAAAHPRAAPAAGEGQRPPSAPTRGAPRTAEGPMPHDPSQPASEEAQLARLSPKAQSLYRRGQAALRTGDRASATLNLRLALASQPQSTFLREALARLEAKK